MRYHPPSCLLLAAFMLMKSRSCNSGKVVKVISSLCTHLFIVWIHHGIKESGRISHFAVQITCSLSKYLQNYRCIVCTQYAYVCLVNAYPECMLCLYCVYPVYMLCMHCKCVPSMHVMCWYIMEQKGGRTINPFIAK